MNALALHTEWQEMGFAFEPLAAHVGFVGNDATQHRSMLVLGDSLGVQQAELGLSFANKATHNHNMRLLAVFLGTFFPDWQDGGQWLKRTLGLLSRGQAVKPIERGGYVLQFSHSRETALLVARVEVGKRRTVPTMGMVR
jgi:hypothetical protein